MTNQPNSVTNTHPNAAPITTTLQGIAKLLGLSNVWVQEQEKRGERVTRYRAQYDGDHDIKLNPWMRQILEINTDDDGMQVNLMKSVVDMPTNRTILQSIEGVEDKEESKTEQSQQANPLAESKPEDKKPPINESTKWVQEQMDNNEFDVIQSEVHEAAYRDGDSFLLSEWDNKLGRVKMTVEEAWDGQSGILMDYPSRNLKEPRRSMKVWQLDTGTDTPDTRLNVYYKDRVEKYIAKQFEQFEPFTPEGEKTHVFKWDLVDGQPIGIPVIHFRNGGRSNYGVSRLRNAIPVQNALNRAHHDLVAAAALTAFAIVFEVGFQRDSTALVPGMVVQVPGPFKREDLIDMKKLEGSDLTPLLSVVDNERLLIGSITNTPSPDMTGASQQSGEYLKQLDVNMVAEIKRFMNRAGSSWEQVFDLFHKIQRAYGTKKPPAYKRWISKWKSPEVRNDAQVVESAMKARPVLGDKQTVRNIGEVYGIDNEEKVERVLQERREEQAVMINQLGKGLPSFGDDKPFGGAPNGSPNPLAARMGQQVAEMSKI